MHSARRTLLTTAVWMLALAALAGWLRFRSLGAEAFWGDEFCYIYLDSAGPATNHAHTHGFDAYLRCYAKCVHLIGLGITNETVFRALPATLGVAAVLLIFLCGVRCGSRSAGVVAAVLAATSPFAVDAARTATQYGHLFFAVAWMMWAAVRVWQQRRWYDWLMLAASSALAFHLQVFATCAVVGVWGALGLCSAIRMARMRRFDARWAVEYAAAGAIVCAICLPEYLGYVRPLMANEGLGNLKVSSKPLWASIEPSTVGVVLLSPRVWQMYVCLAAALVGIAVMLRRVFIVPAMAVCICIVVLLVMHATKLNAVMGFPPRYLSFLLPFFWLCAGWGLWHVVAFACRGARVTVALVSIMFLPLCCLNLLDVQARKELYRQEWRELARFFAAVCTPDDIILGGYDVGMLSHYATNLPCCIKQFTGDYMSKDVTTNMFAPFQEKHARVWSLVANSYFRWEGGERVQWMDTAFIPLCPFSLNLHYWSRAESAGWTNAAARRASEIRLLRQFLAVAPGHYNARKQLANALFLDGQYVESMDAFRTVAWQYPLEPWNYHLIGVCWRDGLGVARNERRAARWFTLMDMVAAVQGAQCRDARIMALKELAETRRRLHDDHGVLRACNQWESVLRGMKLSDAQLRMEQHCIAAQRVWACERAGLVAPPANLLSNASFQHGLTAWGPMTVITGVVTSVSAVWRPGDGACVHITNQADAYAGVYQEVQLRSGNVYHVSGCARSPDPAFDGRLVIQLRANKARYFFDCYGPHLHWSRRSFVFTNDVDGGAEVMVHLGVLHRDAVGEFTDIRVEDISCATNSKGSVPSVPPSSSQPPRIATSQPPSIIASRKPIGECPTPPSPPPLPPPKPGRNLLADSMFKEGWHFWQRWCEAAALSNEISLVSAEAVGTGAHAARIENPRTNYFGVQQRADVVSGGVYRLCGTVRSVATNNASMVFGGRIAFYLQPQPQVFLLWYPECNQWTEKSVLFTNQVTGTAVVYAHMGFGNVPSTGEFTNIRLEQVGQTGDR